MADLIVPISTFILAVLTGIYVFLTHRLLTESKKANELNREANEKQFQILTLPHMFCKTHIEFGRHYLTIDNNGNLPAYDVDIIAIGHYYDEKIDVETFVSKYIKSEHKSLKLDLDDEGSFGIYEHLVYASFPSKKSVSPILNFPITTDMISVLLQYRDIIGNNYSHVLWFFKGLENDDNIFKLGLFEPIKMVPSPRISYYDGALKAENEQSIPEYVKKDFEYIWNHSISSGYTISAFYEVEDRGEWADI